MQPRLHLGTLVVADRERARRSCLEAFGWPAALEACGQVVLP